MELVICVVIMTFWEYNNLKKEDEERLKDIHYDMEDIDKEY
jgi:hypothetical protein